MTREYTLQGLSCANCAVKIERSVRELNGVSSASVNFMTTTLRIEATDSLPRDIHKSIEYAARRYEPDIIVSEKSERKITKHDEPDRNEENEKKLIVRLVVGAVILAVGMLLEGFSVTGGYVPLVLFVLGYLLLGGDIFLCSAKNIARGQIFDENFLMAAATVGAFAIGEYAEALGVMLFYQVGELFQDMAVRKSKKSIAKLMDIRPDFANIKRDGVLIKTDPETVRVGDLIVVKPGEKIPLDGAVTEGESMLDTAALTGESVPRHVTVSDTVLSGCVNQSGLLTVKVTQTFGESTVSKIIDLVENAASKKAPTENFITTFARYYTPAVVGLAALIIIIPPLLLGGIWADWLSRGLIFLVISCPCALVVSIPLGFFGGIGGASKRGILIKGGNYLEALNKLDIVVFDKTGTLTKGVFKVTDIQPVSGFCKDELLETAAKAESFSNHPIALSIMRAYGRPVEKSGLSAYSEIAGHGVSAKANGKTILAGNQKLMSQMNVAFEESAGGGTKVYVAADDIYLGCITISDEVKPDSGKAIAALKAKGVRKTVMLTGDNPRIAQSIGAELNLDEVYGGLLPQQKVEKVELLNKQKRSKSKLAFVGDGINDAPVLAMADIGVAMGGLGSDAAIEAADIVLMTDEPLKLAEAVEIARFTKRIVWQNIVFALGIKALFLLMGAMGLANMWEAVFADVGVALLAILNAMRVMRMK